MLVKQILYCFQKSTLNYQNVTNEENVKIDTVKFTKLLGMWIDEDLNWKNHMNQIFNEISQGLFCLNSVKKMLLTFCKIQNFLCISISLL